MINDGRQPKNKNLKGLKKNNENYKRTKKGGSKIRDQVNLYNSRLPAVVTSSQDSHPNEDNLTRKVLRTRVRTLSLPSNIYARRHERRSALYISCKGGCMLTAVLEVRPWDLLSCCFDVQKRKNKVHDRLTQRGNPGRTQKREGQSPDKGISDGRSAEARNRQAFLSFSSFYAAGA